MRLQRHRRRGESRTKCLDPPQLRCRTRQWPLEGWFPHKRGRLTAALCEPDAPLTLFSPGQWTRSARRSAPSETPQETRRADTKPLRNETISITHQTGMHDAVDEGQPRRLPRILTRSLPGSDDGVALAQCVASPRHAKNNNSRCQWSIGVPNWPGLKPPTCL